MKVDNFNEWIEVLSKELDLGRKIGLPKKVIQKGSKMLGNYYSKSINPDIPENILLKQLWQVADKSEKDALSSMMIKYVDSYHHHN